MKTGGILRIVLFILFTVSNVSAQKVTITAERSYPLDEGFYFVACGIPNRYTFDVQDGIERENWLGFRSHEFDSSGIVEYDYLIIDSLVLSEASTIKIEINQKQSIESPQQGDIFIAKDIKVHSESVGYDYIRLHQYCLNDYPNFNLEIQSSTAQKDTVLTGIGKNDLSLNTVVQNTGAASSTSYDFSVYFSEDDSLNLGLYFGETSDLLLHQEVRQFIYNSSNDTIEIACEIPIGTTGNRWYYIFSVIDKFKLLHDTDEGREIIMDSIYVVQRPSDVSLMQMNLEKDEVLAGDVGSIKLNFQIKNNDPYVIPFNNYHLYLSIDSLLDEADIILKNGKINYGINDSIKSFSIETQTNLNVDNGNYYVLMFLDSKNEYKETDESNNLIYSSINIQEGTFDLELMEYFVSDTSIADESLSISVDIKNIGTITSANWVAPIVYLSNDGVFDDCDVYLGNLKTPSGAPKPNVTETYEAKDINFFKNVPSGNYYLIIRFSARDDFPMGILGLSVKHYHIGAENHHENKLPLGAGCVNTIVTCNDSIYDSGGSEYNTLPITSGSILLLPEEEGKAIQLSFEEYSIILPGISSDIGGIMIYDGNSELDALFGDYKLDSPGEITANNSEGALLIKGNFTNFLHDYFDLFDSGFKAKVSCVNVATNVEMEIPSLHSSIFPNPSSGLFYLKGYDGQWVVKNSNSQIAKVGTGALINLENFTNGVYFLQCENKIFKLIKQ